MHALAQAGDAAMHARICGDQARQESPRTGCSLAIAGARTVQSATSPQSLNSDGSEVFPNAAGKR